MFKQFTVLSISLLLAFSVVNAQKNTAKRTDKLQMTTVPENAAMQSSSFYQDYVNAKLGKRTMSPVNGDSLVFSNYDYGANQVIRQMIDPYDFDNDGLLNPVATAMVRKPGSVRGQEFIYGDPSGYANIIAFDTVANKVSFGWGTIVTPKAGPLQGQALLAAHASSTTWLTKIDLTTFAPSAPVKFGSNFPSIFYANDGTIWAYTGSNLHIYKSTDNGATFTLVDSIGSRFPDLASLPSEMAFVGSSDGKNLSLFGTFGYFPESAGAGAGIGLINKDSTDFVGWLHSEDNGATWRAEKIGYAGYYGEISNRVGATYYRNFGQLNGAVDDRGVAHMATNGYGEGLALNDQDTINTFTLLYWNSTNKTWQAVSDRKAETDSNYDSALRPGNAIGQSYPSISVSADGNIVFVIWQANEYSGTPGESSFNIYPGDGGAASTRVYYSDIYAAYSTDGGNTFGAPVAIASRKNVSESYPSAANRLEIINGQAVAHFLYYEDVVPGTSIFDPSQNTSSLGPWIYKTYTFNAPTDVENNSVTINKFDLEQNYPNPFNPATRITYSLEKSGLVTLKVYDILGKEVAAIINNKAEAAGKHTVSFNGSSLSSGMYLYTLTSNNSVITRKMVLLK